MHEDDDSIKFQSLKNIPLDDVDFGFNVPEETEAEIDNFENPKDIDEQENKIIEPEKLEKHSKSAKEMPRANRRPTIDTPIPNNKKHASPGYGSFNKTPF